MPNAASNAIDYAKFRSRSHHAVIRVYDEAGNAIEDARARGPVQRVVKCACRRSGGFRFLNANNSAQFSLDLKHTQRCRVALKLAKAH